MDAPRLPWGFLSLDCSGRDQVGEAKGRKRREDAATTVMRIPSTDSEHSAGRFKAARALACCSLSSSLNEERGLEERGGSRHREGEGV